ncbi:hypothetical protein SMAC4_13332 [Sordaria macrospora]|uniref:uncharacterized protein n=1 Tax=Sordaria macrospora TaxID=5147 RepID=UPI002B292C31|nr:hypothetical protein SMAC4_13332 [Sordaria macrospora]
MRLSIGTATVAGWPKGSTLKPKAGLPPVPKGNLAQGGAVGTVWASTRGSKEDRTTAGRWQGPHSWSTHRGHDGTVGVRQRSTLAR